MHPVNEPIASRYNGNDRTSCNDPARITDIVDATSTNCYSRQAMRVRKTCASSLCEPAPVMHAGGALE
jgi:hypothetical protein